MLTKLRAALNVLRKGERVADPTVWENSALIVATLTPFLISLDELVRTFGFETGLTPVQLEALAHGIATAAGIYLTVSLAVTSRRVGLLPAKKPPQ